MKRLQLNKTFTYKQRFEIFEQVTKALDDNLNGQKLCVKDNKLGDEIQMKHRFGSPSVFGEAWIAHILHDIRNIAVKKVVLMKTDQQNSYTFKQLNSGESAWVEMTAYLLSTALVLCGVTQNLPVTYKYFWCPKCEFENKDLEKKSACLLVLNELADGDLTKFLQKKELWSHNNGELISNCLFQILAGLYALKKFFNMTHNDLHDQNILVHKVEKGGYWHYKIDNYDYYLPNLGFVFVIWDFGTVHIPHKMKGRKEFAKGTLRLENDQIDVVKITQWILEDLQNLNIRFKKKSMKKSRDSLKKKSSLKKNQTHFIDHLDILRKVYADGGVLKLNHLLKKYFQIYSKKPKNTKKIGNFDMSLKPSVLKNVLPKELKKFVA